MQNSNLVKVEKTPLIDKKTKDKILFILYRYLDCLWAVSSVGRASGLHPEGREFEPLTAHH